MSTPLESYVAPAGARRGFWRPILGLVLILAIWFLWTVAVMFGYAGYLILSGEPLRAAMQTLGRLVHNGGADSVLFQLATFVGIWPGIWLAVRLLHAQPFRTLFSPESRIRWRDFFGGILLAAVFSFASLVFALTAVGLPERTHMSPGAWVATFVPLAVLVFLQASGEEMIFRGYLLQQFAVRFRSPLMWAVVPALLFGFAHYSGGEALHISWHYVAVTALFGLASAALVWRTGSLAASMGLHTGMNLIAICGIGVKGVLQGAQLYLYDPSQAGILFTADGVTTTLILLLVLSPLCPFGPRPAPLGEAS